MRTPASFCGLVGLKTTKGALSTAGIVPLAPTFDTPGPIARSVVDVALAFASMKGAEAGAETEMLLEMDRGVDAMRIAIVGEKGRRLVRDPAQLQAFDRAVDIIRSLGAEVTTFDFDVNEGFNNSGTLIFSAAEGYFHHKAIVDDPGSKMDARVRSALRRGKQVSAQEYIAVDRARADAMQGFLNGLDDRRAWLTPTTACLAIPLEGVDESGDRFKPGPFTGPVNFFGMCAIAVPISIASSGLPSSLQVVCRPGDENTAMRIARAFERERGPLPAPPLLES